MTEVITPDKTMGVRNRIFHVSRDNAGFLGLGVEITVIEDGKPVKKAVVYGDALHAVYLHVRAQVTGDPQEIEKTSKRLPKKLG